MQDFRNLKVWQKAHALTVRLYRITRDFPRAEMFGLSSHIRRAAGSIGANLAEGCGRWNQVELARFVQIAMGSASELQNHLRLAKDLGFPDKSDCLPLTKDLTSIRQMPTALLQTLRRTRNIPPSLPANGERRMAKVGVTS